MSYRWILVGAIAMFGTFWFVGSAVHASGLGIDASLYVAHLTAPAMVCALMMTFAPMQPAREPVRAIVIGVALISVFYAGPRGRSVFQYRDIGLIQIAASVLLSIAGAYGGALLGRRVVAKPRFAAQLVLASMVMIGLPFLAVFAERAFVPELQMGPMVALMFGGVFGAGFLTQLVIAEPRAWRCGWGVLGFFAMMLLDKHGPPKSAYFGFLVLLPIAALGAKLSWRLLGRPAPVDAPDLPSARVQ